MKDIGLDGRTCNESCVVLHDLNSSFNSVYDRPVIQQDLVSRNGRFPASVHFHFHLPIVNISRSSVHYDDRIHADEPIQTSIHIILKTLNELRK